MHPDPHWAAPTPTESRIAAMSGRESTVAGARRATPFETPVTAPGSHSRAEIHHGVEIKEQGWFHAESNRREQEQLAGIHLDHVCRAVDERHMAGLCPSARWTNDPAVFPDLRLKGTATSSGIVPFAPHDRQFFVGGALDQQASKLRETAVPGLVPDEHGCSTWVRLPSFADHEQACSLFGDAFDERRTHMGRVLQGSLDNGYLVEALQAISLRPRLARQLFYCWDSRRSIYVARLFKHGTWMRVELDDYVPVGAPSRDGSDANIPICCRSEGFPHVLWPSLAEKAYAKVHTLRCGAGSEMSPDDRGGWEAVSGGGRVEEALADLTGGVAGRFQTCDVSMDRLFLYMYELQRDTLFVCRPHELNCELHGVRLNPYYPNVVNRACVYEGKPYVQVFSGAHGVFDGGLQDISVPFGLLHCADYPETSSEGFFWMSALDFHEYFDTIFECRLVNSGDVSIRGMPPPRLPPAMPPPGAIQRLPSGCGAGGGDAQHVDGAGLPLRWFESVFANPGEVTRHSEPEFNISVPASTCPCDVVISVEQIDPRMLASSPARGTPAAVLVKVYESLDGGGANQGVYSNQLVCKSNWIPVRDSMAGFTATRGGDFKVVVELADSSVKIDRMIFRCYASKPNVRVFAATATASHALAVPSAPPAGQRLSFVGSVRPERVDRTDAPEYLNEEHDCLRKPEFDIDPGWTDLKEELQRDCSLM